MAYRADIEIAVRGAQELKRLQNEIRVASDAVNSLNSNLSGIANLVPRSFDNLNKTVAQAARSFNAAALGTKEATDAAREYVRATDEVNNGLRERVALLAKVRAEQRRTVPGDAGTGQQTPALPPQLIRTYEIGKNWVKFFQDAAEVALDLRARSLNTQKNWNDFFATATEAAVNVKANSLNTKASWNDFFATAAQAAVNVKANSLNTKASWNTFFTEAAQLANDLTDRTREIEGKNSAAARKRLAAAAEVRQERATFLAGAPVSQFPIGPNQRSSRRGFEGDTSVERAESALRAKELKAQQALNVKFFAEEKAQVLELDRLRAASAQKQTQRIQAVGKAVQGSLSSAAIGGAFPLLFGQSPQAAVGGAIGGLLGGAGGGFAGSLLGTALGELEAAKARTKELAVELGLSSTQAQTLATAFELAGRNSQQLEAAVTNIQGLGLSTKETASAIKIAVELSKEYGGSVEKIAQSFADTLEAGKVSISTLNKFTSQGIPVQDELAAKFGVSRTKLLEMTKDGQVSVQQLTDALVKMGQEAENTADKGKTGFDRFTAAVQGIASAIAGAAGALLKTLIPALDVVLTKLSDVITRATQAINLIADAQVGEASAALAKSGFSRGTLFANKGNIDDLTQGLKSLQPLSAKTKEQFDRIADVAQRYRVELQQYGGALGEYAVGTAQVELTRVIKDLDVARKAVGAAARPDAITGINAPANLSPSGSGGGRSKTDKAAEDAKREAARVAQVIRDQEFITKQKGIQTKFARLIFEAEQSADPIRVRQLQTVEALVLAGNETARLLEEEKNSAAQLAIARTRQGEAEAIRQEGLQDVIKLQVEQQKNFDTIIADLDLELALKTATTEQAREQLRLEAELAKLKGQGFTPEQIDAISAKKTELAAPKTDQQNITEKIGKLKDEITQLTSMSNIAITSAEGIGNAFAQSFQGLITGAMSAKEALGTFFKSVGDMFVQMATEIIAKQITMIILQTLLKALGGGFGGGGASSVGSSATNYGGAPGVGFNPGAFSMPALAANGATFANGIAKFANGGVVNSPTLFKFANGGAMRTGLMGEAGPEAIMPLKRGPDGSLGVQANGLREAMNQDRSGASGAPVLNMSFQSTNIAGVEYVSREQLEQAMFETRRQASRDGAQRGMSMTLDKLQQSPSTRRRVGI